ncbi:MAG: hypothetical protein C6W55_13030 [Thermobacillus sp.]|uniref:GT-D fold domain-containing glycosyltransferase n=1 Tax=Thermobacillus sp. TaxID=2108467 RepID=UPI000E39E1C0|nr:GT-D fold domain-containing glycosyltransferase [Thermobacillus sp.]REK53928.1 MAG: hypothetical protein C6W55_13030 [Thermobacillus sp.]
MDRTQLMQAQVLQRIAHALKTKSPLSLVRVGDGENLVLAQQTVWPIDAVLKEPWAVKANEGKKGLRLPNLPLRDAVAESIRKADIVGILPFGDRTIHAPDYLKRKLTDRVFRHFRIVPKAVCHACVNRMLATDPMFWKTLAGKRIAVVTHHADAAKRVIENRFRGIRVTLTYPFSDYSQMEQALKFLSDNRNLYDIALFSCGVNAVVLAQRTAEQTGKVALDFGKALHIITKGRPN